MLKAPWLLHFPPVPSLSRCGSRTGGPNTPGSWDTPGVKARKSALRPRTPKPAPLRPPLRQPLSAPCVPGALCSLRAQVSAVPLRPAPSESCPQQDPTSPATTRLGGTLGKASRRWSRLRPPQFQRQRQRQPQRQRQCQPRMQSGLRAPTPRISHPTLLRSMISQSCSHFKTLWRDPRLSPHLGTKREMALWMRRTRAPRHYCIYRGFCPPQSLQITGPVGTRCLLSARRAQAGAGAGTGG